MIWLLSILAFLVIFSVLILVHELGHFWVAKKCGVKVEEFGFGMPPRIWKYQPKKSETMFSLNAIPFGGFVRLYGEDSHDQKVLNSKRSFASKPAWMKLLVIVAGVVMNFLLAFVLLCIGFAVGMQPLIGTSEDAYNAVRNGTIKIAEGLVVKEPAENDIGFKSGDKIVTINGQKILFGDEMEQLKDQQQVVFQVERSGQMVTLKGLNDLKRPFVRLYDSMVVPRLVIEEVGSGNNFGLRSGQEIVRVNGQRVFTVTEFDQQLSLNSNPQIETVGVAQNNFPQADHVQSVGVDNFPVIISAVLPGSNAAAAGLKVGDRVEEINQMQVKAVSDLPLALKSGKLVGKVVYKVYRQGVETEYYIHKGADGLIGVVLSLVEKSDKLKISFYTRSIPHSVLKIEDVSYPILEVPGKAIEEIGKLSVLTAQMFVNVFSSVITRFSVPDGVAGPVGIAQMTFVFVQEGLMSLIRFTALLSLSLGIINILPFPGLDGGRFFLIIVPMLLRKKLNPRLEAMIHLFGFLFLMVLILLVTFNDIARLFV